ncbi:MAG: hypothetical protein OSJ60_00745 [Lachnospiraceae bacterium]|jgi:hypothetical protein|nr:hypothetical protein [Lachnospiraceae bacterium]
MADLRSDVTFSNKKKKGEYRYAGRGHETVYGESTGESENEKRGGETD